MRKGFTLIELMVASLLLSMLVVALTMMFNQSSIAWRTGVAGVAELNDSRSDIGRLNDLRDDLLPGLRTKEDMGYRTVSIWNGENLRTDRAYDTAAAGISYEQAKKGGEISVRRAGAGVWSTLVTVGVRSAGPDRRWNTSDDITTWPDEVN